MRLPLLSAKELSSILHKMGFILKRQKGSHLFFYHPDGRSAVVPYHPNEKIDEGLLNKIVKKDLRVEGEEFFKFI